MIVDVGWGGLPGRGRPIASFPVSFAHRAAGFGTVRGRSGSDTKHIPALFTACASRATRGQDSPLWI
jgi:hypothetical protein